MFYFKDVSFDFDSYIIVSAIIYESSWIYDYDFI